MATARRRRTNLAPMRADQGELFTMPADRRRGRNRRQLDATIAALRATGRIEKADAALCATARAVADALDRTERDPEHSEYTVGYLARTHLAVVNALLSRPDLADSADLDNLLAELSAADVSCPPGGHPAAPRPPNPRRRRGQGGGRARFHADAVASPRGRRARRGAPRRRRARLQPGHRQVPRRAGKTRLVLAVVLSRILAARRRRGPTTQARSDAAELWRPRNGRPRSGAAGSAGTSSLRYSNGSESVTIPALGVEPAPVRRPRRPCHSRYSDVVVVDEGWWFDAARGRELEAAISRRSWAGRGAI